MFGWVVGGWWLGASLELGQGNKFLSLGSFFFFFACALHVPT